jgi:hypothetical protein
MKVIPESRNAHTFDIYIFLIVRMIICLCNDLRNKALRIKSIIRTYHVIIIVYITATIKHDKDMLSVGIYN